MPEPRRLGELRAPVGQSISAAPVVEQLADRQGGTQLQGRTCGDATRLRQRRTGLAAEPRLQALGGARFVDVEQRCVSEQARGADRLAARQRVAHHALQHDARLNGRCAVGFARAGARELVLVNARGLRHRHRSTHQQAAGGAREQ